MISPAHAARMTRPAHAAPKTFELLLSLALGAVAALLATAAGASSLRYTDLRSIEQIHGNAAAGATKAAVCLACHGADGVSVAPTFPRLAGQREDYLYHRLISFARSSPKDPYYSVSPMTSIASGLSDVDMQDLAAYFAGQTPRVPEAAATPAAATAATAAPAATPAAAAPATATTAVTAASTATQTGEALFLHGNPAFGIPPCQGCHGSDANGPLGVSGQYAAYPSLRGQYAPYVTTRLNNFRKGQPSDTSNTFIMHGVAEALDDDSINAIAAWLASLPPSKSL